MKFLSLSKFSPTTSNSSQLEGTRDRSHFSRRQSNSLAKRKITPETRRSHLLSCHQQQRQQYFSSGRIYPSISLYSSLSLSVHCVDKTNLELALFPRQKFSLVCSKKRFSLFSSCSTPGCFLSAVIVRRRGGNSSFKQRNYIWIIYRYRERERKRQGNGGWSQLTQGIEARLTANRSSLSYKRDKENCAVFNIISEREKLSIVHLWTNRFADQRRVIVSTNRHKIAFSGSFYTRAKTFPAPNIYRDQK